MGLVKIKGEMWDCVRFPMYGQQVERLATLQLRSHHRLLPWRDQVPSNSALSSFSPSSCAYQSFFQVSENSKVRWFGVLVQAWGREMWHWGGFVWARVFKRKACSEGNVCMSDSMSKLQYCPCLLEIYDMVHCQCTFGMSTFQQY